MGGRNANIPKVGQKKPHQVTATWRYIIKLTWNCGVHSKAERWTSVSLCFCVCLSVCLSVYLSVSLCVSAQIFIVSSLCTAFSLSPVSLFLVSHPPAEGTRQESSAKDMALNKHPKPATSHEIVAAGPAISWQMRPAITNTPLSGGEGGGSGVGWR